ncbi:zinc uptake transcriptional repressor Zur [Vibrio methylphosphonaticus]|uniref:zinc uptake transcriptional repressor Zur n=1 Tax=Vibrio methylphosphonaticus TaxID=2946866 RepID=UPI00202A4AA2|nr:zinc uptake transcriptional repressor Zur [Vibrio methylphosphonaticus]MCL9777069.1 zinc uptake transcriptional repressor Zur [Vibrio methylphosphonaticus]
MNQQLIQQVEDICTARGVRLTPQRRSVFVLICENKKASSAYELLEQLKASEPKAKPPTVYRALDFLLEQGFIHRVESTNSFVSCSSFGEHKHFSHLLICDKCGNVVELQDDNLIALLNSNVDKYGFQYSNHVIESHGTCQTCSSLEDHT